MERFVLRLAGWGFEWFTYGDVSALQNLDTDLLLQ